MGHGKYSPIHWHSPPSQYMSVPQNSPVHSTLDPVNLSYLLSGSPGAKKPSSLPQQKRNRAPTFPGADPPNISFFEGSKKSDWSTYGSDSRPNSQWSEEQRFGSPKHTNRAPTLSSSGNSPKTSPTKRVNSPFVSQDARNFQGPVNIQQQSYQARHQDIHQQENQYPYHNNELSPPRAQAPLSVRSRKQHFARPTMIEPALPNITWIERTGAQPEVGQPSHINGGESFGCYQKPLSSVDSESLSPVSSSAGVARSSSPLIVTSVPVTSVYTQGCSEPTKVELTSSLYVIDKPCKPRFTFNPKAEDFVLAPKKEFPRVLETDEYVGFYLNPEVTPFHSSATCTTPFIYDCDPMAWQVPDILTPPKSQSLKFCGDGDFPCSNKSHQYAAETNTKELIGKVPKNMNWEKKVASVVKEARAEPWASMDFEDRIEIMDTITEGQITTILDKHQEKLGTVLGSAESHIIPEAETKEIVESPLNISSVKNCQEVSADEVTQTIIVDTSFFKEDIQNIVKFPECSDSQHFGNIPRVVKADPEQAINVRGSDDEEKLFGDSTWHIVKLPDYADDIQASVKSLDWAGDVETHAASGQSQESYHTEVTKPCAQPSATGAKPEARAKTKPKKKAKSKSKAKPEPQPRITPESKPQPEPESKNAKSKSKPKAKPEAKTDAKPQIENLSQRSVLLSENYEAEPENEGKERTPQKTLPAAEDNAEPKTEGKLHPNGVSSNNFLNSPGLALKETKMVKPFNYRDALLTKVTNPQTSIAPLPKIVHSKAAPQKAITPKVTRKLTPARVEITLPPAEMGGRRKFFLHPIPTTATYDSVTRQLKGGMLEDIYISGLSPHPSAWKGPRGAPQPTQDASPDNSWYGHVSFYSAEGARKFWDLVQSGRGYSGPYQSRYGGFDDQEPGVFFLDGTRVLVNWRHNDQRVANPLTVKAVTEENATRCLLITFDIEAALKSPRMAPFLVAEKETENSDGLPFIKKVAADIEIWGQADSNLQGIHLLDNASEPKKQSPPNPITENSTNEPPQRQVKVLVSFIKLLTAAKIKKYFSNRPDYGSKGFCKVEYYKDECDEPIDTFKAIRETKVQIAKQEPEETAPGSKSARQNSFDPQRRRYKENATGERAVTRGSADVKSPEEKAVEGKVLGLKVTQGMIAEGKAIIIKEKEKAMGGKQKKPHLA